MQNLFTLFTKIAISDRPVADPQDELKMCLHQTLQSHALNRCRNVPSLDIGDVCVSLLLLASLWKCFVGYPGRCKSTLVSLMLTTRIWHWKAHWKSRVTLKIERTKDMSNAENCQWNYKGLTFLDNNSRQISVWLKRKCDYLL